MHSLSGCTATVGGNHSSVSFLVKLNAKLGKPLNCLGSITHELGKQLSLSGKVSATECVNKVYCGGVVGLICRLNTALCHHCVCIAHTKLGNDHNISTRLVCLNSRRCTCSATADNENVCLVIGLVKAYAVSGNTAMSLKYLCKLLRYLVTLVGTYLQNRKFINLIVGVEGSKHFFLLLCRHTNGLKSNVFFSGRFYQRKRFLKLFRIHLYFLLIFQYHGCCKALSSRRWAFASVLR